MEENWRKQSNVENLSLKYRFLVFFWKLILWDLDYRDENIHTHGRYLYTASSFRRIWIDIYIQLIPCISEVAVCLWKLISPELISVSDYVRGYKNFFKGIKITDTWTKIVTTDYGWHNPQGLSGKLSCPSPGFVRLRLLLYPDPSPACLSETGLFAPVHVHLEVVSGTRQG